MPKPSFLNVTLVQYCIAWEDIQTNLIKLDGIFNRIGKTDIILLPETFSTGFTMKPERVAEEFSQSETIAWMRKWSVMKSCTICGSICCKEENKYFNRLVAVQHDKVQYYDKHHLFSLSKEDKAYTSGNAHLTVTVNQWGLFPLICYDLRFPVWSRNTVGYDVLIYSANWPAVRQEAWNALLKARAIENQAYVAGINRTGKDGNSLEYVGGSSVYSPSGELILDLSDSIECVQSINLDYAFLTDFRNKYPFLEDRDDFIIKHKKRPL